MESCWTRNQIKTTIKDLGYRYFEKGSYNVNIIGIRNGQTQDKITNAFDDQITISYKDAAGNWKFHCWKATTDPGKYWSKNLLNANGVAILKEGQYQSSFAIGLHQGKYEALCQRAPVKVYRDANKDSYFDHHPDNIHEGIYGINIHKAGSWKGGSVQIDKWSAGCQVFSIQDNFYDFMNILNKARDRWGNSFTYTLINSQDIC